MEKEKRTGLWAVGISIGSVILVGILASLFGCGGTEIVYVNKSQTSCSNQVLSSELVKSSIKIAGTAKVCNWLDKGIYLDVEIADCSKDGKSTSYKKYYYLDSNFVLYYKNETLVYADGLGIPPCANKELVDEEEALDKFNPVTTYCKTNSYLFCQ